MPTFFPSATHFRDWLAAHAATHDELVVGYWKRESGRPSMTWPESVDEALCVGWIDGVRRRIDALAYEIRFTPRRAGSIWSAVNIAKAEALIAAGRMQPAGVAAYAARTQARSAVYAYEQRDAADLTAPEWARFRRARTAFAFFASCPNGYRQVMLHWVVSAVQPATRERRLGQLIEASGRGERLRK